jgi:hypothetical protein
MLRAASVPSWLASDTGVIAFRRGKYLLVGNLNPHCLHFSLPPGRWRIVYRSDGVARQVAPVVRDSMEISAECSYVLAAGEAPGEASEQGFQWG